MESRKFVYRQTGIIALGVGLCVALMIGIFALVGAFDLSVLWGGLCGGLLSVGNFFFMALVATVASDKAMAQDVDGGQKLVKSSYPIRLLILAAVLFALAKSGICNVLALVLPLAFVRPVLTVAEFFKPKGV